MFQILATVIAGFLAAFALLMVWANYLIIFGMWRKGLDKPLFGLVGPICILLAMLVYMQDVNWVVFWIFAVVDPGGVLTVLMGLKFMVYDCWWRKSKGAG